MASLIMMTFFILYFSFAFPFFSFGLKGIPTRATAVALATVSMDFSRRNNSLNVLPCGCLCGRVQMGVDFLLFESKT